MKRQPLRIPRNWKDQDRDFVIQLERVLDDVYSNLDAINKKLSELENELQEEE